VYKLSQEMNGPFTLVNDVNVIFVRTRINFRVHFNDIFLFFKFFF
jgi:hypothetical protein